MGSGPGRPGDSGDGAWRIDGRRVDTVVIGSGPAGAAVADRLATDGRAVVLLEAGPGGPRPAAIDGLDLVAASAEPSRRWSGLQVRDRPHGPRREYVQGRGLGGSSSVNGMVLARGDRLDYRRWEDERGCAGWGPDAMGPWLDLAAAHYPTIEPRPGPVSRALAEAARDDGLPGGGTTLDGDRLGVLAARLAAVGDRRWSAADAHLGADAARGGRLDGPLTVVTGATVDRIVHRARTGRSGATHRVELVDGERVEAPEIVVCAGGLGTPALLLRSGLVRPSAASTPAAAGFALRDHPSYAFTLVLRRTAADEPTPEAADERSVATVIRWASSDEWPGDLQAIVVDRVDDVRFRPRGPALAAVAVGLMAVTSDGRVGPAGGAGSPAGAGPVGPEVVTGALATDSDRRRLRAGVLRVARWLRSPAMAPLVSEVHIDDRGTPLDRIDELSVDELDRLIASRPGPYAHPAAACPMGPEGDRRSVTAFEPGRAGELLGFPGVRVADASALPDLVRGGLQLPVAAVAERIAADLIGR